MKDQSIQSQNSGASCEAATSVVDVEVAPKPKRRKFTAEYKLRILEEIERAQPGEQGAILRREGLYSSHIADWRVARRQGALGSLSRKRGRKSKPDRAAQQRIASLERIGGTKGPAQVLARAQPPIRRARARRSLARMYIHVGKPAGSGRWSASARRAGRTAPRRAGGTERA